MKKLDEWQLQQEFAAIANVDDLQVKGMVKRRIGMLFAELEKLHMPRNRAIEMLALILREFQQEFAMNQTSIRQATRLATMPPR